MATVSAGTFSLPASVDFDPHTGTTYPGTAVAEPAGGSSGGGGCSSSGGPSSGGLGALPFALALGALVQRRRRARR